MMLLLIALLIAQAEPAIDDLVRDLGSEEIEVRERAHQALLGRGSAIAAVLRRALRTGDEEFRIRANRILDVVERAERERLHDLEQKEALLLLHRRGGARADLGEIDTEGARFKLSAHPFDGGWILRTHVEDYFQRRSNPGAGRSLLQYEIQAIKDERGRDLRIERCGFCSPRLVYVKAPMGAFKVRLQGEHVWFSPYLVEFKAPEKGHARRIGDFTIEVTGVGLRVQSASSFAGEWIRSMESTCDVEFNPDLKRKKADWIQ